MVEYALILALVSVVAIGTLKLVGGSVNSVFTDINNKLTSAL
jgi:Flp pilus assembly pilin Flp